MRDVVEQFASAIRAGRPVAWCRLVETRGSTPQKAGAAMLVHEDGSQAGTLGGGCVEAEVKRRALGLLAENRPEICTFNLDSDYGWDDGLICGGRMEVLIEPVLPGAPTEYFEALTERVMLGLGVTESVVFNSESTGLSAPSSYLFDAEGQFICGLRTSPGDLPRVVTNQLKPLASRPRAYAGRGVA